MGNVYGGIHQKLAIRARDYYRLGALVETGTGHGETALWAKDQFEKVITIEILPNLFKECDEKFAGTHNVLRILGDSREWLDKICRGRDNKPTLFWLDAHWTSGTDGVKDKCPVLEEIRLINENFYGTHVIMVDDDMAITRAHKWETSADIIRALEDRDNHDRYVRIIDDVYFATTKLPEDFDEWTK